MRVDLRLYALVDPQHAGGRELAELARLRGRGRRDAGAVARQARARRARMVERARAIKAALPPSACRCSSTTASTSRSPPAPTACMSGRTTWRPRTRGGCSAPTRSSGCRSRRWRRPSARRSSFSIMSASAACSRTTRRRTIRIRRSVPAGLRDIAGALHRRAPQLPVCAIAGIDASNAARRDCGRRRRRRGDFGAVARGRSRAGGARAARHRRSRAGGSGRAHDRRSRSPSPARIRAAAPASRPTSRRSRRSASTAPR